MSVFIKFKFVVKLQNFLYSLLNIQIMDLFQGNKYEIIAALIAVVIVVVNIYSEYMNICS